MTMMRLLRLSSLGAAALLTLAAPTAVWATDHKPAACEDRTPHKIRMVKVAPGVELEVLDWGGKGKAMVLLTGRRRQRARLRSVRLPVHRLLSCHRDHPPRLPALEPAPERLRRPDPGSGRHRGARCPGHRQGGVRRAFGRRRGTEQAGTGLQGARRQAGLSGRCRPVGTLRAVAPRAACDPTIPTPT